MGITEQGRGNSMENLREPNLKSAKICLQTMSILFAAYILMGYRTGSSTRNRALRIGSRNPNLGPLLLCRDPFLGSTNAQVPSSGVPSHISGCLLIAHVTIRSCSGLKAELAFGKVIFRR
jgi:hypothetical protein